MNRLIPLVAALTLGSGCAAILGDSAPDPVYDYDVYGILQEAPEPVQAPALEEWLPEARKEFESDYSEWLTKTYFIYAISEEFYYERHEWSGQIIRRGFNATVGAEFKGKCRYLTIMVYQNKGVSEDEWGSTWVHSDSAIGSGRLTWRDHMDTTCEELEQRGEQLARVAPTDD
jgi:hypothetical protein